MEQEKSIIYLTTMLALTAGFCDTVTFVSADQLFSAHVTGNFIVFAFNIIKSEGAGSWIKLLSFPTFIIAVIAGGQILSKSTRRHMLLIIEGIILITSGILASIFILPGSTDLFFVKYAIGMLIVFAMGLQNVFGKIFSKETYGPTTMMTGNVTQAALDLGNLLRNKHRDPLVSSSFHRQAVTIGSFLIGCVFGAFAGKTIGLSAAALPGIALIMFTIIMPNPK